MRGRAGNLLVAGAVVAVAAAMAVVTIWRVRAMARESMVAPPEPPMSQDAAAVDKDLVDFLKRPWRSRRGAESDDAMVVFVRVPVDQLAAALALRAVDWQKDVLGREVVVGSSFGFVFRLEGHPWSLFVASLGAGIDADDQRALSRALGASVIEYVISDTAGVVGYELFEAGRSIEAFSAENDRVTEFRSELRDAAVPDGPGVYDFVRRFLVDHDAYEPGIQDHYFFGDGRVGPTLASGSRRRVGNPGFFHQIMGGPEVHTVPELERVDYLVFKR